MNIAITTGGGDAPGLNAVIRSAVLSALGLGWTISGLRDGMRSLLVPEDYPEGPLTPLNQASVRGITFRGGTILGSTNQAEPHRFPRKQADGTILYEDRTAEVVERFRSLQLDALISVGGDGSMAIAANIARLGFPVVGVPKTIDNDLDGTVVTFGFDTAVEFATQCIDRLHSTAESHGRVMVVEVMGRYAGWIALESGLAGTADIILLPEIPFHLDKVAAAVKARDAKGLHSTLIVVAEGARLESGDLVKKEAIGSTGEDRLGGIGEYVAKQVEKLTGKETRSCTLGHLQRGGAPTSLDRILGVRFGVHAVKLIKEGKFGRMVSYQQYHVGDVAIEEAVNQLRLVTNDSEIVDAARSIGVSFGD